MLTEDGLATHHEGPDDAAVRSEIWTVEALLQARISIPDYQRPYRWSVKNVDQLIHDIWRFRSAGTYRVGTVILHDDKGGPHDDGGLSIVDGQQRYLTFALLVHWFAQNGVLDERRAGQVPNVNDLPLPGRGLTTTRESLVENYRFIDGSLSSWSQDDLRALADFVLDNCEVVVLRLTDLDAAFQMFDSQNSRGRALYPTDLLKAFHIREMSTRRVSPELRKEMVNVWEAIPASSVNALFSDYLYKIKRWANGLPVSPQGFTSADIDMFKGIREGDPANAQNKWSIPFLYAKNFTDDFQQENDTLIRYGALRSITYPFQIDQPVLNGETFFAMVDHYYRLSRSCGLFSDDEHSGPAPDSAPAPHPSIQALCNDLDPYTADQRFTFVRNLLDCLLLYYVDRFDTQEIDRATKLISRHTLALRVEMERVTRQTINNYALGRPPRAALPAVNLFSELRQAQQAGDFLRRPMPATPDNYKGYAQLSSFFTT